MQVSENNELNFVFKINKITHLLNHVDIYYQKEILKDIKRYNIKVNNNLNNIQNQEDKKKVLYYYLNKYLDNIINDQLNYLIETYHQNNKDKIFIDAEKNASKSINLDNKNKLNKNINNSVNNIKEKFYENISISTNNDTNNVLIEKINNFFCKIKIELLENVETVIEKKIEKNFINNNSETSKYIQKKIKDFLKIFLKDDEIYNDLTEQMNNEINKIYDLLKQFQKEQLDLEVLIEKYITNNEKKFNNIEKSIYNKINTDFENKIKTLVDIFNNTIHNSINNSSINENQIIRNIENKIIDNNNFSKNNFEIKFCKENNEIQLYYYNDLITSTKINLKGLIGPKGPQGIKGDSGDITIIRNIEINEDETIKFIMQNGTSIYEINTENKLPKGPRGEKGNSGDKGDPGDVNINLKWDQDNVMKINKENFNNLILLKSLSIGDNSHCLTNNALSIGDAICYKNNSISLGKNSSTSNENSIAFFGNTLGKNSLAYYANDVDENCVRFGSKENNKYNIENINLKAREIILDCDELILNDNNFKNNKILELEEKINNLYKEINYLKK